MRLIQLLSVCLLGSCSLLFLGLDRCGDSVVSLGGGELCDDGNSARGDGCDDSCQTESGFSCPNPGEPCLPDAVCQAPADCADDDVCTENEDCVNNACVNSAVNPDDNDPCTADSCDPSSGVSNDTQPDGFVCVAAPRSICLGALCAASACGDGFVDSGAAEQCDDGNDVNTDSCPNDCTSAICGDGSVEGAEECDDNNTTPNDGCDAACQVEGLCGNNVIEPGEQCDDGNLTNGDGCEGSCLFICGGDANPTRAVQNGATCLLFFDKLDDWVGAEIDCISLGGHLASIAGDAENARVDTARGANPDTWIGLNDRANEANESPDAFVWSDGTANNFENFDIGEPSGASAGEDCVEMISSSEWNDELCNVNRPYVCER